MNTFFHIAFYVDESSESDEEMPFQQSVAVTSSLRHVTIDLSIKWLILLLQLWTVHHSFSANSVTELLPLFVVFVQSFLDKNTEDDLCLLNAIPKTWKACQKFLGINPKATSYFAVCAKCYKLHRVNELKTILVEGSNNLIVERCSFIAFPHHVQANRRTRCGSLIADIIRSPAGQPTIKGRIIFPYKSLIESLQQLLMRKGFSEKLEEWRHKCRESHLFTDIYSGNVWKEWTSDFFSSERSLGLMLNIDWFQPFKKVQNSVAPIYLVLMNLPRNERYKRENLILVGIIPNLEKEPTSLNTFLKPLVDELKDLWSGIRFSTFDSPIFKFRYRAALLCVACDIPAARKVCGFKGHAATKGCSKCSKEFPGSIGQKDYSGFDVSTWPKRNLLEHKRIAHQILGCTSRAAMENISTKYGVRYSSLLDLEYFDVIRFCIVDPMHNLFLGTAKHMFKKIWIERGILDSKRLPQIQMRVNSIKVPSTIGRIPCKIASNFAEFKADEWKNWTLIFSLFSLRNELPQEDFKCWQVFVKACRLLTRPSITSEEISQAHSLLIQFCRTVERLYGKEAITPNMHLHCHLAECIRDFGPIYSFWLFSFERYNGMLGKFPTNCKRIESQVMERFQLEQQLYSYLDSMQPHVLFSPLATKITSFQKEKVKVVHSKIHKYQRSPILEMRWEDTAEYFLFNFHKSNQLLSLEKLETLRKMLSIIFSSQVPSLEDLPRSIISCKCAYLGEEIFSSIHNYLFSKHGYVTAQWCDDEGKLITDTHSGIISRPGKIQQIFCYKFTSVQKKAINIPIAEVYWSKSLQSRTNHYGSELLMWNREDFNDVPSTFVPLARLNGKYAPAFGTFEDAAAGHVNMTTSPAVSNSVLFTCPIQLKIFFD